MNGDSNLAVFCDFENIALGVRDAKLQKLDIRPIVERLLLKGSIVAKKAYCDWDRYKEYKPDDARGGVRADRDPAHADVGEELGRHQDGRRRPRPLLHEGAHRHLRHRLGRLRLLAAGQQAARERQVGDRRRREELHVRPAGEQLRRVHLLRRSRGRAPTGPPGVAEQAAGQGGHAGREEAGAGGAGRSGPGGPRPRPADRRGDLRRTRGPRQVVGGR